VKEEEEHARLAPNKSGSADLAMMNGN